MEPFNFCLANEDHNCYTYDMRKLDIARNIHTDHVGPVLTLDFSPTGREFVTGSYDKSLRIFPTDAGRSRDVYYLKRMQRIFAVQFSGDAKYILSGSDDTNVRLWKARASENLEVVRFSLQFLFILSSYYLPHLLPHLFSFSPSLLLSLPFLLILSLPLVFS